MLTKEKNLRREVVVSIGKDSGAESLSLGQSGIGRESEKNEEKKIASKETRSVKLLRCIVAIVMFLSTVAVATTVFVYTRNTELSKFHDRFYDDAFKVHDSISTSIERILSTIDVFASTIGALTESENQTWPFVTIPKFPVIASKVRSITNCLAVTMCPLVTLAKRTAWEKHALDNQGWVDESISYQETDRNYFGPLLYNADVKKSIFADFDIVPYNTTRTMCPTWQNYPAIPKHEPSFNWDFLSRVNPRVELAAINKKRVVIGEAYMLPNMNDPLEVEEFQYWVEYYSDFVSADENAAEPITDIVYPIMNGLNKIGIIGDNYSTSDNEVVGIIAIPIFWRDVLQDILPTGQQGLIVVFDNPCTSLFTYEVNGPSVNYIGRGDLHEKKYDHFKTSRQLFDGNSLFEKKFKYTGVSIDEEECQSTIHIYPSDKMINEFISNDPIIYTMASIFLFLFASLIFVVYDINVERRQKIVARSAEQTGAIVLSLFPANVRDKMLGRKENSLSENKQINADGKFEVFPMANRSKYEIHTTKPLADIYLETTIFFADIAGFTSWSSVRDPFQVFTLLETLFGAFDKSASRRKVFKIETIGDCYVAATGLPKPSKDHATTMAKFGFDCLDAMSMLVKDLEKILGPGTLELTLRVGLNSGPTTAGVLRGEKSRFQVFGDTVNTASRMESTGSAGRIHVSQATADLIIAAGKQNWLQQREDAIEVKGKGKMITYWVHPKSPHSSTLSLSGAEMATNSIVFDILHDDCKVQRLIDWNYGILKEILVDVQSVRSLENQVSDYSYVKQNVFTLHSPRDEYTGKITSRQYDMKRRNDSLPSNLSDKLSDQLYNYVSAIAYMYKSNPFHDIEHASHVVMNTFSLLQNLEAFDTCKTQDNEHGAIIPELDEVKAMNDNTIPLDPYNNTQEKGHDSEQQIFEMLGSKSRIPLDPLASFALIFSALIHDIDHCGLSNAQLVAKNVSLVHRYRGQSVAEQNSITIAWELLTMDEYTDLFDCLFPNHEALQFFRQIVVCCVLATDIFDPELKAQRKARWDEVYGDIIKPNVNCLPQPCSLQDSCNKDVKLALVFEQLMQVSDIAHTMQRWEIYQKWNGRLFEEMYMAYSSGEVSKNPSRHWYEAELSFFDNYVIPLGKKLKQCGAFSSQYCDELLNNALENRSRWENDGKELIRNLLELVGERSNRRRGSGELIEF